MSKSLFITFEGVEGAGKTTLIESVSSHLNSQELPVLKTREPGGTELGENIRSILLSKSEEGISIRSELALFLASRAQHVEKIIEPALAEKKIVLCDRFNDSSIAYQGAARGLGIEEVTSISSFFSHYLQPDLTFYLDLDPAIGFSRISSKRDRIESESLDFHHKIREAFLEIGRKEPDRIKILDASKQQEEVFQQAMPYIKEVMQEKGLSIKM